MTPQHCPTCGGFLAIRTSHTAKNPGRKFIVCHHKNNEGVECNYFKWMDEPVVAYRSNGNGHKRSEWREEIDPEPSPVSVVAPISVKPLSNQETVMPVMGVTTRTGLGFVRKDASALSLETKEESLPVTARKWSPYQESIFNNFESGSGNVRIEAVAGSGKTTTTAEGSKRLPKNLSIKFMVFSKANAIDMQNKVPEWVEASTAHSGGYADIRRQYPDVKLEERKTYLLLDRRYEYNETVKGLGSDIARLVSLCKNTLKEPTSVNLDYLCDRYGIVANGQQDTIYDAVAKLYADGLSETSIIDFDDMIFLPAVGKVTVAQSDILIIDEAQDTNAAQQSYYLKAVKSDGRLIFVGDTHQAIFGFRGADTEAMDNLSGALHPANLPLSICYRCGKAQIELAKTIVPQIEAWSDAPDGKVADITEQGFTRQVRYGDMVLCRLNAPLVKPAFDLIRAGKKATIRGRNLGKGLSVLIKKMQKKYHAAGLNDTLRALAEYVERETAKLVTAHKQNQADTLSDQYETIVALSDGCYTVGSLEARISQVFSDDAGEGVIFSTVHKAKGLEADRVYILKPELLPFPKAKEEWQKQQELHLCYVAYTRAKSELYFVR